MNLNKAQLHDSMVQLVDTEPILLSHTNPGHMQWGAGVFAMIKETISTPLPRINPSLKLNHSYGYLGGDGQGCGYLLALQYFMFCATMYMPEASIKQ